MQTLQQGTLLQGGKYRIVKVLGQGGFGITYLALQSGLERKVAIKEFFMKEHCNRDETTSHVSVGSAGSVDMVERFKAKFLKEASNIARLNHPNIVRIYDIFEENGTAYYVMEYAGNGSLADKVKQQGQLSESVAKRYILQVADALDYIHQQKMNHLDVKPANIMLSESDDAILIDFGMSKQYDAVTGNQTSTTPIGISHGYAPMEQYNACGVSSFSPQTDIYSLGATLYKLVTGKTPPQASELINEGLPRLAHNLSTGVRNVIIKSMQVRKNDRPENIKDFLTIIESDIITAENDTTAINSLRFEDDVTKVLGNQDSTTNGVQTNGKKPTSSIDSNENKNGTKDSKFTYWYILFAVLVLGIIIYKTIPPLSHSTTSYEPSISPELSNEVIHNSSMESNSAKEFNTRRFSIHKNDGSLDYKVEIDYPVEGNENLTYNIKEWIVECLLDEYNGSLDDPNRILELSYNKAKNDPMVASEITEQYTNIYKTNNFVTYQIYSSMYYEGAAHGISGKGGITFRVKDGRRYGWDMMNKEESLKNLIIDELKKQYFHVNSDGEFFDCLIIDGNPNRNSFPFPAVDPWITSEGVVFQYGEYEIAAYSYGKPYCVIPLSKVQQYFTLSMKRLLVQ